ncbi:hypothetical protein D3C81_1285890 [compost metagenome]
MCMPVAIVRGAVTAPTTIDDAQFIRGDTQQGFVENAAKFLGAWGESQCIGCLLGADGRGDDQLLAKLRRSGDVVGDDQ